MTCTQYVGVPRWDPNFGNYLNINDGKENGKSLHAKSDRNEHGIVIWILELHRG